MKYFIVLLVMTAWVTRYNTTGTMASGKQTYVGAVACPRSMKLGTKVEIDGKKYTCEDRYAKWVQKRQGNTFDIYDPRDTKTLLKWGKRKMEVKVL